ncbi:hypothetical protein FH972_023924 [Carpinus fangiana]|uniref:Heterokaryon incompatibility domain-containing protein n=1 Tax=Carpinus fangiana TaxID=176857 RepID=A0A5N6KWL0_9ROSI|nr:hypothetical protein FH972_023924 [Carpinus fangiana]
MANISSSTGTRTVDMKPYPYQPLPNKITVRDQGLNVKRPAIRLFVLPLGDKNDRLSGKIILRKLKDPGSTLKNKYWYKANVAARNQGNKDHQGNEVQRTNGSHSFLNDISPTKVNSSPFAQVNSMEPGKGVKADYTKHDHQQDQNRPVVEESGPSDDTNSLSFSTNVPNSLPQASEPARSASNAESQDLPRKSNEEQSNSQQSSEGVEEKREAVEEEPEGEDYEALSYYWGATTEPSVDISILIKDEAYRLSITPNLASALKHLRLPNRNRKLWVDAICIDQANQKEKSQQISIMDTIYREAKNVCVWLGDPTPSSPLAFELIDQMIDFKRLDRLVNSTNITNWAALAELMRRPWFSRRWIVQEIAYAQSSTVHCGETWIPWQNLADSMALFASKSDSVAKLFKENPTYNNQYDYLGNVTALGAYRLVLTVSKLFRKSDDGQTLEKLMSLESLISNLAAFRARQPHDTIYAILSLAYDAHTSTSEPNREDLELVESLKASSREEATEEQRKKFANIRRGFLNMLKSRVAKKTFHVDYKKRFFEVCRDFIDFSVRSSGKLDILCRPWAPSTEDLPKEDRDLPSWICSLSKSPYRDDSEGRYQRVNADLLVGLPDEQRRTYSASARRGPDFGFGVGNSLEFYCSGLVLDYIQAVQNPASEGNVPNEWLEFGGWTDLASPPPESFWRTLVADRDANGQNPPTYYARACRHAFSQRVAGGALNTERAKMSEESEMMREYLTRLQAVLWMRRLIKTRKGTLGLVPEQAHENDMVCILHGCSVPMILRRTGPDFPDSAHVAGASRAVRTANGVAAEKRTVIPCELIGECYIHGMMDGAAFKVKRGNDRRRRARNSSSYAVLDQTAETLLSAWQ